MSDDTIGGVTGIRYMKETTFGTSPSVALSQLRNARLCAETHVSPRTAQYTVSWPCDNCRSTITLSVVWPSDDPFATPGGRWTGIPCAHCGTTYTMESEPGPLPPSGGP